MYTKTCTQLLIAQHVVKAPKHLKYPLSGEERDKMYYTCLLTYLLAIKEPSNDAYNLSELSKHDAK